MNRWRVLSVLAFPLFALAFVVALPHMLANHWAPWGAKQMARPFLYLHKRAQGWRVVGGLWTKGRTANRKVRS